MPGDVPVGGAGNAGRPSGDAAQSLDLVPPASARRTARLIAVAAVVLAAAVGGVVGLIFGRVPGLVAAVVVLVPLLLMAIADRRKRIWLDRTVVHRRGLVTQKVDIRQATRMELVVTNVRGKRTVCVVLAGPPRTGLLNKAVSIALASYSGDGQIAGVELGIVALRRLADEFAEAEHSSGLVYSELLVAQLRAEARGADAAQRPLVQIAAAVAEGSLVRRIPTDALVRFVGDLE